VHDPQAGIQTDGDGCEPAFGFGERVPVVEERVNRVGCSAWGASAAVQSASADSKDAPMIRDPVAVTFGEAAGHVRGPGAEVGVAGQGSISRQLALVDGAIDLLALFAERRPTDTPVPSQLYRLTVRVMHHVLFPEDGFRPDSRVVTLAPFERDSDQPVHNELQAVEALAVMMLTLADSLPGSPSVLDFLAGRAAEDPAAFDAAVSACVPGGDFQDLVTRFNTSSTALVDCLLTDGWSEAQLLERLDTWGRVETSMLEILQRVADHLDDNAP
jgi:hypothetical protein